MSTHRLGAATPPIRDRGLRSEPDLGACGCGSSNAVKPGDGTPAGPSCSRGSKAGHGRQASAAGRGIATSCCQPARGGGGGADDQKAGQRDDSDHSGQKRLHSGRIDENWMPIKALTCRRTRCGRRKRAESHRNGTKIRPRRPDHRLPVYRRRFRRPPPPRQGSPNAG